ncbi:hypothetical protein DPEC_G00046420 [Dallia pectoralis]|uniref:Uncharacterized protein n=1 Tax=Dallia pectoralis TaxID=75939 RepID=A0ACC2H9V6_DALPE|nr:hypothetical protein DPEC_G00046420 [Dallia pectoralis]
MGMENFKQFLAALVTAVSVGFLSIFFVLRWVLYFKEGLAWDGGLAEFNWHPVLTVTGFIFLQGIAIVVYRLPWTWKCSKLMMKFIHAGLHMLAFIFVVISLVAVFDFHNSQNIPNMYSLHSWVGLSAVIQYTVQLVLGVCIYLIPLTPTYMRAAFMPLHVYSGLFIFATAVATALMGITEKLIFGLKDPKYKDSPPEATFVNVLGVLIVFFGAIIIWIVTRSSWKRPSESVLLSLSTNREGSDGTRAGISLSQQPDCVDPEGSREARRRSGKLEDSGQVN